MFTGAVLQQKETKRCYTSYDRTEPEAGWMFIDIHHLEKDFFLEFILVRLMTALCHASISFIWKSNNLVCEFLLPYRCELFDKDSAPGGKERLL
jgi:hypothetical protein